MSLSIETVDLISFLVVEGLVWEVLLCALHDKLILLSFYAFVWDVINEMDVLQFMIQEQVNEDEIVSDVSASNEWIREGLIAHGVIVVSTELVEIDFVFRNLLLGS